MTTDPLGIITDVNQQMEALTGATREDLIGSPFKTYFTDAGRAEDGIRLVLREGKVTNYELTARSAAGGETVVSYNATTFNDRGRKTSPSSRSVKAEERLSGIPFVFISSTTKKPPSLMSPRQSDLAGVSSFWGKETPGG